MYFFQGCFGFVDLTQAMQPKIQVNCSLHLHLSSIHHDPLCLPSPSDSSSSFPLKKMDNYNIPVYQQLSSFPETYTDSNLALPAFIPFLLPLISDRSTVLQGNKPNTCSDYRNI